jgi:hypothetical protein
VNPRTPASDDFKMLPQPAGASSPPGGPLPVTAQSRYHLTNPRIIEWS